MDVERLTKISFFLYLPLLLFILDQYSKNGFLPDSVILYQLLVILGVLGVLAGFFMSSIASINTYSNNNISISIRLLSYFSFIVGLFAFIYIVWVGLWLQIPFAIYWLFSGLL
jgi:hypothetical protein